jgi:CubicO group peptidase (beta-lactamase class C family)
VCSSEFARTRRHTGLRRGLFLGLSLGLTACQRQPRLPAMVPLHGFVAAGYEAVRVAFAQNFAERGEVGAAVAAWAHGEPILSLWGGHADANRQLPWTENTVVIVFSMTKGLTATCVHHLAERGGIDLDLPVAEYWPEFGVAKKSAISTRMVLSHRAGLPVVEGTFSFEEVLNSSRLVAALAQQTPLWAPGTQHGYHFRTFGWLVGEVFRRASGRTIGRYFAEEIARPRGIDWYLGFPESEEPRIARLIPPPEEFHRAIDALPRELLLVRAMTTPSYLIRYDEMWNERSLRACEMPSTNSVTHAAAAARLYAEILGWGPRPPILQPETVARATRPLARGYDQVLRADTGFASGYQVKPSLPAAVGERSFGHQGAGGSVSYADPQAAITFAYTTSRMRFDEVPDPRSEALTRALYEAHGARN